MQEVLDELSEETELHTELHAETMEIDIPYIRFDDTTEIDPRYIFAHNIQPLNEDKRIRVFSNQMLCDIIEETTLSNFNFHVFFYYKKSFCLQKRFPHRETDLVKANIIFWEKMQQKYKELKKIQLTKKSN